MRYYLLLSRMQLASTADGVPPWRHAYFGQRAKHIEAHFAFSRWLNLAQAAVSCIYNTTVFVYSRCYALMRRGPDDKLYSCDGTHGMSYWATSPLIRPRNYQYHHRNEGHCAREGYCFMDDPKHEQPDYAALRWMSEDLRARRELFRQFRRELLKVKLKQRCKQAAAAAAYLVPLCLLWWRLGMIRAFSTNWRHDVDLVHDLGELVGALLILTFNGLIVWMICRKVKNPGWEVGWRIIFFCILFYLVILLAGPPNL